MAVPSLEPERSVVVQLGNTVDAQAEIGGGAQHGLHEGAVLNGLAGVVDPVAVGVQAEGGGDVTVGIHLVRAVGGGLAGELGGVEYLQATVLDAGPSGVNGFLSALGAALAQSGERDDDPYVQGGIPLDVLRQGKTEIPEESSGTREMDKEEHQDEPRQKVADDSADSDGGIRL